jgi:cyclohexadieny/prephenate dehydrogenase
MTVIGCGLIGGSIIRAAREPAWSARSPWPTPARPTAPASSSWAIADHVTGDIAEAVKDADLVVIATPVLSTPVAAAWPRT